jgi:hypothetical protein
VVRRQRNLQNEMLHVVYSTKYYHIVQIIKDRVDRECSIGT